jgi:hypothetical protein
MHVRASGQSPRQVRARDRSEPATAGQSRDREGAFSSSLAGGFMPWTVLPVRPMAGRPFAVVNN